MLVISSSMITIIDYGLGNLFSVKNALDSLKIDAHISNDASDIKSADLLILPGVGAFRDGIKYLKQSNYFKVLNEAVISKKKKIIGLCLGMQLMAGKSYEGGEYEGLGWIKGKVKRLTPKNKNLKLPHIGWNDVKIKKHDDLLNGFDRTPVFYFVHSYHLIPENKDIITGVCDYGEEFVATLHQGNIYGAQFHPEKSQSDGLKILKNFSLLV